MPRSLPPCLLALALLSTSLRGQDVSISSEVDWDKMEKPTRVLRQQLFRGDVKADLTNKDHLEAIDFAAKEAVYRLYWHRAAALIKGTETPKEREERAKNRPTKILTDFEGALDSLNRAKDRGNVASMQAAYTKAVAGRARDVILQNDPISTVNAARILYLLAARPVEKGGFPQSAKAWGDAVLPRLAADTGDAYAGILAELAASPRVNDGAKYYLLRGLGDLLSLPRQAPPLWKKETEDKGVRAAVALLARKTDFTLSTPRDQLEGFKILRVQAVRVLAASGQSILDKEQPALWLARIAAGDALVSPYPRVEERIEAAAGLGRMVGQADKHPDLVADYAAHQVAIAVAVFAQEANANLDSKTVRRVRPWKADASRLLETIEAMKANKDAHVTTAAEKCRSILVDLADGKEVSAAAATLVDWVLNNAPPSKSLIKGDASATVILDRSGTPAPKDEKGADKGKGDK